MTLKLMTALATLLLVLAGCASQEEDDVEAELTFSGTGGGTHMTTLGCDEDAYVSVDGEVYEGALNVTVSDGNGTVVLTQEYQGEIDYDSEELAGMSGNWTITAKRIGGLPVVGPHFSGDYTAVLRC